MQADTLPIPANESERVIELSDYDFDYSTMQDHFKDLTSLAAKIAGTQISLVNLIDTYTQWSISSHGIIIDQMPRQESVCQYTITGDDDFEVSDLSIDDRFKDKFYVSGAPNLRYYFGIPLRTAHGSNIGALCLMDTETKHLSAEKVDMLKLIAREIVNRLQLHKYAQDLKRSAAEAMESKMRVAHDIRGPVAGVIGLSNLIIDQGEDNSINEVLKFVNLICKSGNSLLDLADEILNTEAYRNSARANAFNQLVLAEKLQKLYTPQALNKGIHLTITTNADTETVPFSKNKLLQIIGNIISNSIKFTPQGGGVAVNIDLQLGGMQNTLIFTVADNGVGMCADKIDTILTGECTSTDGTFGEHGYGFGLPLVKQLIEGLNGNLDITSIQGEGSVFTVIIPQSKV